MSGTTTPKELPGTGNDIGFPLSAYTRSRVRMRLPEALMGGTEAMRRAGNDFLPQEDGESDTKYAARLARSVLLEAYRRTIQKLAGEVFKEPVTISDDVPEEARQWLKDADNQGNDITTMMTKVFAHAIHEGVNHVLVEYPPSPGQTREEHRKAGARPYLVEIKPKQIIGWRFKTTARGRELAQVRIKETHIVDDGLYGQKEVTRIRLLEAGRWAVYEFGENGWGIAYDDDGNEMAGTTNLSYIPLVTIFLGEEDVELTAWPPLMPLAHLNCSHWQSASDQRNILHYARLVTWFGKMLEVDDDGQVLMGANRLVKSESPDGDLKVVEHSGAAISAGRQDLEDIKNEMALFGLSLMIGRTGTITATENAIDKGENDSALYTWVRALNNSLAQVLDIMCEYVGETVAGSLKANDDFSGMLSSEDPALLIQAYEAGLLPRSLVIEELKARGVIMSEIDVTDLLAQLAEDQKSGSSLAGLVGSLQTPASLQV